MLTIEMLKEWALRLEHNPQGPITLAFVIAGKPYRINSPGAQEILVIAQKELNQIIAEHNYLRQFKDMPAEQYSEFEDG